jgi:CheY-like chemotaxis protein
MTVRRVVSLVADLFFAARIGAAAKALGVALEEPGPPRALEACRAKPTDLVIVDLHAAGDPLALVRSLKADERTRAIPIVGFFSHVDEELRRAALEAGVDRVMPRSAFTHRLPALLAGRD